MKRVATLGVVLALSLLAWPPGLSIANEREDYHEDSANTVLAIVAAGEIIDRDYFAFGERVEVSGTVNGDVYAAAGQILVDGTINGDLLAAGGTITVSGKIAQDARLAGGQISISGDMGRNVTVAGGDIGVMPSAFIEGGLVAGGGNIQVAGPVERDAKIAAGNVAISNRIKGHVDVAAGAIRLTSKAAVGGDFTYWSKRPASIDERATVSGEIIRRTAPKELLPSAEDVLVALAGLKLAFALMSFVSTLVVGLLLIHFYPKATHLAITQLREQPWASLGLGVAALLVTPILAGLLAASVVGLPLAVIVMASYLIILYLARIFAIHCTGVLIFERLGKANHVRWAFVVGLILYSLLTVIPVLGSLITLGVILFGLGSALFMKKNVYLAAKSQGMI